VIKGLFLKKKFTGGSCQPDHKCRKNRNEFFVGKVKKNIAPSVSSSEELCDVVS